MDLQIQVSLPDEVKSEIIEAIAKKIMESVSDEIKKKVADTVPQKEAVTFSADTPKQFSPPTLEEITEYVFQEKLSINPSKFLNYYVEHDWKDKKGFKVTDWKAKIKAWDDYSGSQRKDLPNGYVISAGKVYAKEVFDPNAIDKVKITEE